jgi:flagellar biogenesis protein FliO
MAYDVLKAKFNNEKPPVVVIGNYSESHPAVFVVTGIFLILIFAVVYNLFRRFRENVVRALMRPFNFYTDVRDQRMLSIFQTTVVGILGSLSASLFHANVFYFLKTDFYFDSLLAQLVPCIWLKQWLNFSSWNPTSNIIVSTVFIYLVLLLFSFILRAISFFFRKKILLFDAYCVSMWSILPMALLAPFGMVLYRLMDYPFFEFLAIITLIIFTFWIISRLLKGTAIVLDSRPVFFYIGGYLLIAAVLVAGLISMNGSYETFAHIKNIFNLWYFVNHVV